MCVALPREEISKVHEIVFGTLAKYLSPALIHKQLRHVALFVPVVLVRSHPINKSEGNEGDSGRFRSSDRRIKEGVKVGKEADGPS